MYMREKKLDWDDVVQRYSNGQSTLRISMELGCQSSSVRYILKKRGVELGRRGAPAGEAHPNWKGGRFVGPYGYIMVSDHGRTIPEHRFVMERHLGRPLSSHESVHHINGDRSDNRIENLQLRQGQHGKGVHFVCADCGSHNVQPEAL